MNKPVIIETNFFLRAIAKEGLALFKSIASREDPKTVDYFKYADFLKNTKEEPRDEGINAKFKNIRLTGFIKGMMLEDGQGCDLIPSDDTIERGIIFANKVYITDLDHRELAKIKDILTGGYVGIHRSANSVIVAGSDITTETWSLGDHGYPVTKAFETDFNGEKTNVMYSYEYIFFEVPEVRVPSKVRITKTDLSTGNVFGVDTLEYTYSMDLEKGVIVYSQTNKHPDVNGVTNLPLFEITLS